MSVDDSSLGASAYDSEELPEDLLDFHEELESWDGDDATTNPPPAYPAACSCGGVSSATPASRKRVRPEADSLTASMQAEAVPSPPTAPALPPQARYYGPSLCELPALALDAVAAYVSLPRATCRAVLAAAEKASRAKVRASLLAALSLPCDGDDDACGSDTDQDESSGDSRKLSDSFSVRTGSCKRHRSGGDSSSFTQYLSSGSGGGGGSTKASFGGNAAAAAALEAEVAAAAAAAAASATGAVETELHELCGRCTGRRYKLKARELVLNLRRNAALREGALRGGVAAARRLVRMGARELACAALQRARSATVARHMAGITRPEHDMRVSHTVTDRFECGDCGYGMTQYGVCRRKQQVDRVRVVVQCLRCRIVWEL
ncbi:hypothetical protein JKP88DRAFT_324441 [Tribonema minus]|uniref:TFIIS central domain-containing protein n=1 Tax=Tribonema minus TaxID=303371 RepID=A0A835YSL4_9STRA|nr:hypothetical protein JKP88DRAFT_324441 [Tribonema minus]